MEVRRYSRAVSIRQQHAVRRSCKTDEMGAKFSLLTLARAEGE
jgi:hypothetical protein